VSAVRQAGERSVALAAVGADAVEDDLVRLDLKPARGELGHLADASFDVEDAIALPAMEMVVMAEIRAFVSHGLAGHLDCFEPSLIEQVADRAVNRRLSKPGQLGLGFIENLLNAERSTQPVDRLAYHVALSRSSFHHRFLYRIRRGVRNPAGGRGLAGQTTERGISLGLERTCDR